jgi:hypothetical protein
MAIPRNLANIAPHVNASSTELVVNDGGADLNFRVEGDTDANTLFVDAGNNRVAIGTDSPTYKLDIISGSGNTPAYFGENTTNGTRLGFASTVPASSNNCFVGWVPVDVGGTNGDLALCPRTSTGAAILFYTGNGTPAERARIDANGNLLVGHTSVDTASIGVECRPIGLVVSQRSSEVAAIFGRYDDDGDIVLFRQQNVTEGSISVSGSTVSYNGGHLARWAQLTTPKDDTPLFKGTVMSNLDEMNVYIAPTTYWTEEDELPVDEEGNPTVAVGDVKEAEHEVENEQLNKVKVSDVEGDANVAGVFVNWTYDEAHQVDEINMAMTGDMIIRIAQGTTVARGDLLMSAGDGTAKPQGDDIVRSKTIAKVTSTHVTCTYDDGSYCVPCVLMAC